MANALFKHIGLGHFCLFEYNKKNKTVLEDGLGKEQKALLKYNNFLLCR